MAMVKTPTNAKNQQSLTSKDQKTLISSSSILAFLSTPTNPSPQRSARKVVSNPEYSAIQYIVNYVESFETPKPSKNGKTTGIRKAEVVQEENGLVDDDMSECMKRKRLFAEPEASAFSRKANGVSRTNGGQSVYRKGKSGHSIEEDGNLGKNVATKNGKLKKDFAKNRKSRKVSDELRRENTSSDGEDPEVEECKVCFRSGRAVILECDECLGSFHFRCLKPPLKEVPEGD
ncbi:hypothetical protein AMTR_s00132p00084170 [Amborella trichopoda]|uniref:PHD-type domain-containing protein n=1 Tax=Amborella trichopoda TaxID=13333 RepID=W1NDG2_AMBTC|nr:hypothetical protein AMTR_s00132p00084170 [Amborella trichopoda]